MFKILDGRECFWQWDINRYLIVGDVVDEVHFCNRTGDCSLVVKVEQGGLAKVPNILLQTAWDIRVYGYDKEYTKHSAVFKVKPRSKPESYVYTDDEFKVWNELEQRVIELEENGVPAEVINQKIEEYFVANPIPECDLTGYATEDYVDEAVGNVQVDLTGCVTETELAAKGYQTASDVHNKISSSVKYQYAFSDNNTVTPNRWYGTMREAIEAGTAKYIWIQHKSAGSYFSHSSLWDMDLTGYAKTEDIPTEEEIIALIEEHGGGGGALPASEEAEF